MVSPDGYADANLDLLAKHAFRSSPALHEFLSYKRLAARLRISRAAVGIGRARKRVDICPDCRCYDVAFVPKLKATLTEIKRSLALACPTYWDGIDTGSKELEVEKVQARLQSRAAGHGGDENPALRILESTALQAIEEVTAEGLAFTRHFQLRNYLYQAIEADKKAPKEGWLYIFSDWQDPNPLLHPLGPVVETGSPEGMQQGVGGPVPGQRDTTPRSK